jgi:hypothetical protein
MKNFTDKRTFITDEPFAYFSIFKKLKGMSKLEITKNDRRALMATLNDAWHKEHDFIEVTEWSNGEGWDIAINEKQFQLHFTEWDVLKKIIKKFDKL